MSDPELPPEPPPFDPDDIPWGDPEPAPVFPEVTAEAWRHLAELPAAAGGPAAELAKATARVAAERERVRAEEEQAAAPAYDLATEAPLLGTSLADSWAAMRRRASGEDKPAPLPWNGIAQRLGGGLWPGLFVLSGGTGTGKTQWALQAALHGALEGWPVLYCGLELDREGITARLAAMLARRQWSDLYLGRRAKEVDPNDEQRRRSMRELEEVIQNHGETLAKLPFRLDMGPPYGWSYDRLDAGVKGMAKAHPGTHPVVVLDFLQLVTSPPGRDGEWKRPEDMRERIGRAAYMGRKAAKEHGAAVLLLSSTARGNYGQLNFKARPTKRPQNDTRPPRVDVRTMEQMPKPIPFAAELVGLGKESGDIEFAADFVLALAAEWPRRRAEKMIQATEPRAGRWALSCERWMKWRPVHVATAKTRAGAGIGWDELGFNGSWFGELIQADRDALRAWREPPGGDDDADDADDAPGGEWKRAKGQEDRSGGL